MKMTLLLLGSFFAARCLGQGSLYTLAVAGTDGQQHALAGDSGTVLWVVVLPATQTGTDSAFLARVDSIAEAHAGSIQVVAVPSVEDGYVQDSTGALSAWYRQSLDSNIVLSQPLYTHKTSAQQDPVFQWLTNVSQNTHFDDDVPGAPCSYFVDTQGSLYGVLDPGAAFSNKALNRVLQ